MKIYKCDVCGRTIQIWDKVAIRGGVHCHDGLLGCLLSGMDVCGSCLRVAKGVDFHAAAIGAWKNAVETERECT